MYPHTHLITALLAGFLLFRLDVLTIPQVLICGALAVLIDIDHYVLFVYRHLKEKDLSIIHAWNASSVGHENNRSMIHHKDGIIMISVILLPLVFIRIDYYLVIAIAYYSHIILDHLHIRHFKDDRTLAEFGFFFKVRRTELVFDLIILSMLFVQLLGHYHQAVL